MTTTVLVLVSVFVGAGMQRFTGMGFALVAAPFLVLLLGPVEGVILVNLCGAVTAGAIIFRVFRDVNWRTYGILTAAAVVGIVPASFAVRIMPPAVLEIGIGLLLAAGLTVLLAMRSAHLAPRRRFLWAAGAMSGFMNASAGVGGPAVSIYSLATRWPHRSFAATMQPYFFTIGSLSLVAKAATTPAQFPDIPWHMWVAISVACLVGLGVGELFAKRVSPKAAQIVLIVLAYLGAAATVTRGVFDTIA
ncbi:sulfite exporter TauE/SafE family protein [Pseudarthrobacter sp. HLT3-5]|uniref:sulfite exporter TauE/SafE family protein n=1 Tax=Pseudarthrobacter cellobiosi TaxID=2953654 RepID=UPI00208FF842|nr:sulfite exporter TauE/SafE family protein [Pseudarthrobacter sp. HLT3-5]MCO4274602.1 sulfite exporter TauE/SafE family protein [Pseudarthrobacter sp. HLT3-5]